MSVITNQNLIDLLAKATAILNGANTTAEQVAFVSAVFETVRRVEDQTTMEGLNQRLAQLEGQSTEVFKVGDVKYSILQNDHNGWLLMNGRNLSRFTYALLFATHSSFAATGNQIDTFDLPDWRGRTLIGAGQGLGLTLRNLLETGGAETHTLTQSQLPTVSLKVQGYDNTGSPGGVNGEVAQLQNYDAGNTGMTFVTTSPLGDGQSHNNMQPFAACNVFVYSGVI